MNCYHLLKPRSQKTLTSLLLPSCQVVSVVVLSTLEERRPISTLTSPVLWNSSVSSLICRRRHRHSLTKVLHPSLPVLQYQQQQVCWFESEAVYHDVADETLESLMEAVETTLEAHYNNNNNNEDGDNDFEINLANGVLTMYIPPHGTWVINKQTPNQQLWWSSPLSGPKRFEYEDNGSSNGSNNNNGVWFSTKDNSALVPLLSQELSHILGRTIQLEISN